METQRVSAIHRVWIGDDPHILLLAFTLPPGGKKQLEALLYKMGADGERVKVGSDFTLDAFPAAPSDNFDVRDIHVSQRESGDIILSHKEMRLLEFNTNEGLDDNGNVIWDLSVMRIYNPPMEIFHGTLAEAQEDGHIAVEIPDNSGQVYWSADEGATWKDDNIGLDTEYDKTKVRGYFVQWDQQNDPSLVAFDEGENQGLGREVDGRQDEGNLFPDITNKAFQDEYYPVDRYAGRSVAEKAARDAIQSGQTLTGKYRYRSTLNRVETGTHGKTGETTYYTYRTYQASAEYTTLDLDDENARIVRHIGTALPPGVYRLQIGDVPGFPAKAEFHGDALHLAIGTRLYRSFVGMPDDFTQQRARVIPIVGEGAPSVDYAGAGDVDADFGTLHYLPQGEEIVNLISFHGVAGADESRHISAGWLGFGGRGGQGEFGDCLAVSLRPARGNGFAGYGEFHGGI